STASQTAAFRPGGGTQIRSRTASSMEMTSAVERSGPEPPLDHGHLPRPWSCSLEDRTPSLMAPQHLRAWGIQLQGPSVLESKVRALKEKMTAGKQGVSPCLTSHERPSKKPKCRRVKMGGAGTLSEGSSLPVAEGVLPAQNLTDGQLDSGINKEEPAQNGIPRPPRPPSPRLECRNGRSPWPPAAVPPLPDNERSLLPGPGSLQESPVHRVTPSRPGGPGPCNKTAHMRNLRKGRSYAIQDGLVTGGDLDSLSLTCEEDFVPRPALLGGLWRAGELGALGPGGSALSLSDRVERNRLLLQEMLNVGGQGPPKVGIPAWTPCWDRGLPERPAGDVDWDSGISLQDSDQNRTFGPKPESVLSPRHEEAKHLLQRARMKARTRPLRASHEIVPAIAQGSRDGRRSPVLDSRMPFACRDTPQNGNTSDSSSGEPRGPARGNSPRLRASRPREGPRWFWKAESELPGSPQAPHHLPGVDAVEGAPEVKEGRGHVPEETLFPGEDGFAKPPVLESKRASLGSQWQLGPGLGNHWVHQVDSQALSRTAYALASSMKLGSSGPGRQAQDAGSHESLETASAPPLQQSSTEPSALHQAQQPTSFLCHEGWVPTPPSSRKTTSPGSHRKAGLAGPRSLGEQGEPVDPPLPPSRSVVPRTCELSPAQTQPNGPPVRHPLLALSTNNCNNSMPPGLQEPCGGASHQGRVQEGPRSQEPPPENHSDNGGVQGVLGPAAVGTVSPMSTTLSLASEEPEFSREPEEGLQRPEMSSGEQVSSRALPGVSAGPGPPSTAPSDRSKKSSSSLASTLGLKKLFLALGHSTRPQLGKARSYSVEQLQSPTPGPASHTSTPRAKKAPSLQSLHLVSPSHQHRKAASFQNLHSLLNGKGDRSSLYMVGEPGDHSAAGRPAKASPRRALSVEDVSAPSQARAVGRVVEVFPDGTTQLQLQRSPEGTFGFCVASGNGRRDSGTPPPLSWAPYPWGLSKPLLAGVISSLWLRHETPDSAS
uniref:KIAA1614 ortholog n=1 Tax=Ursus maritimus TaxID=29073 RepID=A0A452UR82_URSMA